mmetsp:Transcript_27677/g.51459  ORF Transcript_27677/g.51459 Transcript_27677/m.51459 type:complete len:87 (+) Transcript_27677:415-675(+)
MALLTPEAFDFDNAKALNANLLERLLDFIKLERLDYSFDLFHLRPPCQTGDFRSTSVSSHRAGRRSTRRAMESTERGENLCASAVL